MLAQNYAPLAVFAAAAAFTPGPNNTLLMLSGVNWGFRRALPLLLGIVTGFPLMVFAVGMGLGRAFMAWPALRIALEIACFAYLLLLAWKVARSGGPGSGDALAKPLGFMNGVLFQWVNPKAWMMAISAFTVYVPLGSAPFKPVLGVVAVFFFTGIPSALTWLLFGMALTRFLNTPRRVRVFNIAMAVLLVASMLLALF